MFKHFSFLNISKQKLLRKKLHEKQTADHYYFIDTVASCNLGCPSCPIGRSAFKNQGGRTDKDLYTDFVNKIKDDHPNEKVFVDLYNWTEPFLNKDLEFFIFQAKKLGFGVGLSSNLSLNRDMREIVKSEPDYIRVSLSGYNQQVYSKTHKGGNVNLVISNLFKLRFLLDQYDSKTIIQVGFHIYKSNFPEDFLKIAQICNDLDFIFAPVLASAMQVEDLVKDMTAEGVAFDSGFSENLVLTPEDWRRSYLKDEIYKENCQFLEKRTAINFDGSVPQCCAVFKPELNVAKNFLDTTPEELIQKKKNNSICVECMENRLHQLFTGVMSPSADLLAAERLGPIYIEWSALNKLLEDQEKIYLDGSYLTVDELYKMAMKSLIGKKSDKDYPIKLFTQIVEFFPNFGEGYFQLAKLKSSVNDLEEAKRLILKSVEMAPDNVAYLEEKENILEKIKLV